MATAFIACGILPAPRADLVFYRADVMKSAGLDRFLPFNQESPSIPTNGSGAPDINY
ncbi:hypothetical protein ASPCADRAFT_207877 [Aspergillus carbonarius ITEM 5010]|uniref:Uncharacterized protein n=1 Tax=Aspergillus carbonarius (strain ITEM 5010) TaxID=602072 RepID=A0A1R3RLP0_ASPC5|nr:hypothetical protein ASPCADRAFT_207877 [Aspergillus carbonarius ITEM 5010]